jgi:hypothetical protein
MFHYGEFLSISIFYEQLSFNQAAIYVEKEVGLESHAEINILV